MVELGEVKRDSGFTYLPQTLRELEDRTVSTTSIAIEIKQFEAAWAEGATPQGLGGRYHFQKVHHAECDRRGIALYEFYAQRGRYRAVVAWLDSSGPGYWVSVFKKQGNPQSRASLRTAGDRAVNLWRSRHE